MSAFDRRLQQARNGKGILFCGAGFSADCLNFADADEIGGGAQLLRILNQELESAGTLHSFKDLKNASDQYEIKFGEHGLMNLLRSRFRLRHVSTDMADILAFPWERIYTTNYDNGIELALQSLGKDAVSINNLEEPDELPSKQAIIHLHGYVDKWDIHNFRQSCILGADSYFRLDAVSKWLDAFRLDIDRSEIVIFIGFNAADFHLNQVLFNLAALREKIFFVNRPVAEPDPDVLMTQQRFGNPLYIGRGGLAMTVRRLLTSDPPAEPSLASFRLHTIPKPSSSVPSVSDIEDLFIFGKVVPEHLARDAVAGRSDYHVRRAVVEKALSEIDSGARILLLVGEICDGKTMVIESLCDRLSVTRPVYRLQHPYEDLIDEISRVLHTHQNAAFIIENCFDLREERLSTLEGFFRALREFCSFPVEISQQKPRPLSLER